LGIDKVYQRSEKLRSKILFWISPCLLLYPLVSCSRSNQASEGEDMINLGTLANPNIDLDTFTGEEYALITLDNQDRLFTVQTARGAFG
jgi:hypothetical protein